MNETRRWLTVGLVLLALLTTSGMGSAAPDSPSSPMSRCTSAGGLGCAPAVRGEDCWDIVMHPDGSRAYVTNRSTDNLFVIDTGSNRVVESLDLRGEAEHPLGPAPSAIAITPDGSRLAVANAHDGSLSLVDTDPLAVVETVAVAQFPKDVTLSPDGAMAYVVSGPDYKLAVVDVETATLVTTVDVGGGGWPFAVAASPDGTRVYVAASPGPVFVVDTTTYTVLTTIDTEDAGWNGDMVISPDGDTGYLAALTGDEIIVLDLVNGLVADTYAVGAPEGLLLNADGTRLYVGTFGWEGQSDHHLWVLDTASGDALAGLTFRHPGWPRLVGSDVQGLALAPDGATLYTSSIDGEVVFVVDAPTLQQRDLILMNPLPTFSPFRGAISPDGGTLYVPSWTRRPTTLAMIDTNTQAVSEVRARPDQPCTGESWGIALSPDGRRGYVLSFAGCVLVLDTEQQAFVGHFQVPLSGSWLSSVAMHPDGDRLYLMDWSGTVYVVDLASQQMVTSFATLDSCSVLKLSPDGQRGYAICSSGFAVLDASNDTVLNTIHTGSGDVHIESLFYVGIKPDSSQYAVGSFFNLYVYDAATDTRVHTMDLERIDLTWLTLGQDLVYSPDGSRGYLAMPDENALLVFDTSTWQLLDQIDTVQPPFYGTEPVWILTSPDGATLYVLNELSDNVLLIDTDSNEITGATSLARCSLYLPLLLQH